ncbi:hypothetical protein BHECKSOX_1620 [Bathymodiolus heckerae thiotrophic gill symbiont]|uniref:acyl-homoserine-lactone synthase n=1 Tax=Bathymodiolus heckerae thiotrophic gill symbiont TaxID=1052212 RepID=UPI0010B89BBC|nr:acyl-homoserine-lactone synthase [Bathymodiolus heckerae thiotrophic gill symbiont]SHN92840.1 hypothetical protein BHECKSOX_1620 [Bathymodiolus heckerae thiotrophic gill symbiont]
MNVITGKKKELPKGIYADISKYRYGVFVKKLGWDLSTFNGEEQDQFDNSDAIYVVSRDNQGNVLGCGRLLPTTQPYLLKDVFPQLLNGMTPPNSPDVWELSRFSTADFNVKKTGSRRQHPSPETVKLLHKCLSVAASQGAKRIVTVSPIGVEKLLIRAGFNAHRTGPPIIIDGYSLFACWIEIENQ